MTEVKPRAEHVTEEVSANAARAGEALGAALARGAEAWLGAQADLLSSMEPVMTDWLHRRRADIQASRRAV